MSLSGRHGICCYYQLMVLHSTYYNLHTMYIHLSCYSWPAVFDQLISYLHNPIVTLWVAWPTPTKLDCFQSTIVTLMVAQLPLQLLGIAFSSASHLWLWKSKQHNRATKTLTLCQICNNFQYNDSSNPGWLPITSYCQMRGQTIWLSKPNDSLLLLLSNVHSNFLKKS